MTLIDTLKTALEKMGIAPQYTQKQGEVVVNGAGAFINHSNEKPSSHPNHATSKPLDPQANKDLSNVQVQ